MGSAIAARSGRSPVKSAELRRQFQRWFSERGHTVVPSAPLVPANDPTLYFTNAGMVQFKDAFTGAETRAYRRATSVQRCLRVSGKHNDLENVGRTPRHHTFFEMLGNFSFGDYFKAQAIPMAWELLTGELGIDPNRLWVSIFEEDDEAHEIWRSIGFPVERLQRLGAKENFWSMGPTGPCGPCSEIHYDHGPSISNDTRGPAGEDDRYVEIWNLVFMQYEQHADGTRSPLPQPSIDTGMGLERLAAVLQGVYSNYDTDLFRGIIARAAAEAGVSYGAGGSEIDTALRVLADHARATAFLVADGVMPSNVERGYVLRRIMRRAIRYGVKIGIDRPFFHHVTDQVVAEFADAYPNLGERRGFIEEMVGAEEERFRRTLDRGMRLLDGALENTPSGGELSGDTAFKLSDTYGFPLDLTRLICSERGISVDQRGYDDALAAQQATGRAAWRGSGEVAVAGLWRTLAATHGSTLFTGYDTDNGPAVVIAIARMDGDTLSQVSALSGDDHGYVLLDQTPFYAESGGQAGDTGRLVFDHREIQVVDTTKVSGLHLHAVTLQGGSLAIGQALSAEVDTATRLQTMRNHTATHILHAALQRVLGDHVTQKGSLVAPNRLRFDFSHHKALSDGEIQRVEDLINEQVLSNSAVITTVQSFDEASAAGAMALFGEKYADKVRVVDVPGFSLELCGGTHVGRTGDIGLVKITTETGIAAGVRRIEASTGSGSLQVLREQATTIQQVALALKSDPDKLLPSIRKLQSQRKQLDKQLKEARQQLAKLAAQDVLSQAVDMHGVRVIAAEIDGDLRQQADRLRDQLGTSVVVLASRRGPKALLLVAASSDIAGSRIHAGKLIKELAPLIGGGGGGRPDLAQAGGKNPGGIPAAIGAAARAIEQALTP